MPFLVSAEHIAGQGGGFEPQRKNNFTVVIPFMDTILQQAIESCPLPIDENEVIDIRFGNEKRKVAGPASFNDLQLQVKDFIDSPVMQKLMTWRKKVYDPATGKIGLAKDYKQKGQLIMFGPDGSSPRKWDLFGVWPSRDDPGGGSMAESGNNMITFTLQVDRAVYRG